MWIKKVFNNGQVPAVQSEVVNHKRSLHTSLQEARRDKKKKNCHWDKQWPTVDKLCCLLKRRSKTHSSLMKQLTDISFQTNTVFWKTFNQLQSALTICTATRISLCITTAQQYITWKWVHRDVVLYYCWKARMEQRRELKKKLLKINWIEMNTLIISSPRMLIK